MEGWHIYTCKPNYYCNIIYILDTKEPHHYYVMHIFMWNVDIFTHEDHTIIVLLSRYLNLAPLRRASFWLLRRTAKEGHFGPKGGFAGQRDEWTNERTDNWFKGVRLDAKDDHHYYVMNIVMWKGDIFTSGTLSILSRLFMWRSITANL